MPELKINEDIRSKELLVIAPDGVQVGVLELKKAIIVAVELGLDLVEVSPESKPPVARLMDYGKYKYELSQKAKESRKNQVKISVKEVQLKPKIDTNDYNIKLNQSRKFLRDGDKVKFTMRFRGREAEHPEFGQRILDKLKDELSEVAEVESTSRPDGRSLTMVLAPNGGRK
ncbi:MAG: translation initiation factor IF-3 [Actinobacteria bacterium]|nr:translation initiation factor IF-3 [Actinomycetota bacterium]MBT7013580.1 translation initiation factor IF-3 [Actinomycetota bacterium]MBT7013583.1 translation initiation factor IF-3 [Actinomycetota bacterium]